MVQSLFAQSREWLLVLSTPAPKITELEKTKQKQSDSIVLPTENSRKFFQAAADPGVNISVYFRIIIME